MLSIIRAVASDAKLSGTDRNIGQDGERQLQKLTGDAKKMRKSILEIVRRTCGRGSTK